MQVVMAWIVASSAFGATAGVNFNGFNFREEDEHQHK